MKRMTIGMMLVIGLGLVGFRTASAQVGVARTGEWQCAEGVAVGDLGIAGLDCRGECTLTMNERGEEQAWSFTVEPRINGVTKDGPADGILRAGDVLVAIDGLLITTREGGVRYANIEPGEEVEIRFRRDGRLGIGTIRAGSTCPPPPPRALRPAPPLPAATDTVPPSPPRTVTVGRLAPPLPPDTVLPDTAPPLRRAIGISVAPRVRVTTGVDTVAGRALARARPDSRVDVGVTARPVRPARPGVSEGRLGISFTCTDCTGNIRDDIQYWEFSGPIEVSGVDPGGPADKAGIQLGDQLTAINGMRIESREGGEEFSRMAPDVPVEFTVLRRTGREETVTVVPVTADVLAQTRRAVAAAGVSRRAVGAVTAEPAPPAPSAVPAPPTGIAAPEGMTLRYSGVVEGVEVEVRGTPVMVSEMRGERTILINADGLWIRITVPRGRE